MNSVAVYTAKGNNCKDVACNVFTTKHSDFIKLAISPFEV